MSWSYSGIGIRDKNLEPEWQARGVAGKGGINTKESAHSEAGLLKEAEMQEHIQGLHAW